MVPHKIIAVVEDVDAARYALRWAVQNLLRNGDLVTLIHVYPSSRSKSKKKQRRLRLKGFQLALSFKDLCVGVPEVCCVVSIDFHNLIALSIVTQNI